jgi:hypothetical protein
MFHGCTNSDRQVTWATKLSLGAPNIFWCSQYGTCFIITFLAPRILRWLQVVVFFVCENVYTSVVGFCC